MAQFPNWPLFGVGLGWLLQRLTDDQAVVHDMAGAAVTGLWLFWGFDELLRGVNPWRRVLGLGVIAWQAVRLIG